MLNIESSSKQPDAFATKLVQLTPQDLRQAADRLDHLAREALPGESVLCELTRSIMIAYRPEMNLSPQVIVARAWLED